MPQKPPPTRKQTISGLGQTEDVRLESAEMVRIRTKVQTEPSAESTPTPDLGTRRVRNTLRREDSEAPPAPSHERSFPPAPTTGTRKRESRVAVVVDKVGDAAVKFARTTARDSRPRNLATPSMISKAPMDSRTAFVLSLIDGNNTVEDLIDISGMQEAEVTAMLERLKRLGLISMP